MGGRGLKGGPGGRPCIPHPLNRARRREHKQQQLTASPFWIRGVPPYRVRRVRPPSTTRANTQAVLPPSHHATARRAPSPPRTRPLATRGRALAAAEGAAATAAEVEKGRLDPRKRLWSAPAVGGERGNGRRAAEARRAPHVPKAAGTALPPASRPPRKQSLRTAEAALVAETPRLRRRPQGRRHAAL